MNKFKLNFIKSYFFAILVLSLASCVEVDPPVEMARAIFEYEVVNDNSGTVNFTNLSVNAESYLWDFGDGAGTSTDKDPSYTFGSTGKYTVKLTATNSEGSDETTLDVSVVFNLVKGTDMSDPSAWTFRQVWNDPDNAVGHTFADGAFVWDNADGTAYSQSYLWQEIAVEAGKTYRFNADLSASAGTNNIWFELYFGNADPENEDDYNSNGLRLYVSSFDSPDSGCANDAFNSDFLSVSQNCIPDPANDKILAQDGSFTLSADELTADGTIFLTFKSGSWDSPENYKDGIYLDNIILEEVL